MEKLKETDLDYLRKLSEEKNVLISELKKEKVTLQKRIIEIDVFLREERNEIKRIITKDFVIAALNEIKQGTSEDVFNWILENSNLDLSSQSQGGSKRDISQIINLLGRQGVVKPVGSSPGRGGPKIYTIIKTD